jgi:hypothetical protein
MTQGLVRWLKEHGTRRIIILDNASTYNPLLEYYNALPAGVTVERLDANVGPYSFWLRGYAQREHLPVILTDSDVIPDKDCPSDLIYQLNVLLHQNPTCLKVGPSIRIDDFKNVEACQKLNGWGFGEQKQWWARRHSPSAYYAPVDTTFALYAPNLPTDSWSRENLRTDFPYVIRHLPWYFTQETMTEEEKYYRAHTEGNLGGNPNHPWSHVHRMTAPQDKHSWEDVHTPCKPCFYTYEGDL